MTTTSATTTPRTQTCTKCNQTFTMDHFYMVTKASGKYRAVCKDCYDLKYYGRPHAAFAKTTPVQKFEFHLEFATEAELVEFQKAFGKCKSLAKYIAPEPTPETPAAE